MASVAFKETEGADACVEALNGRWFGGKQLSAQLWDGVTDYQVKTVPKCPFKSHGLNITKKNCVSGHPG